MYLVPWGVPSPGGCLVWGVWSRGCTWSQEGGVPGLGVGGCTWSRGRGVYLVPGGLVRGVSAPGGSALGGVPGPGGCTWSGTPPCGQTDA